jgi:hypothetical protein
MTKLDQLLYTASLPGNEAAQELVYMQEQPGGLR